MPKDSDRQLPRQPSSLSGLQAEAPDDGENAVCVEKGVLRARRDLYWESLAEFSSACGKLLASRRSRLTVDLAAVNFISSSFLGCLGDFVRDAVLAGKRVSLTTTLDTSWLFEILGDVETVEMEVV